MSKSIVSAEEVLENTPDFSNGKGKVFFKKEHVLAAMEEYASQFKESQPTEVVTHYHVADNSDGFRNWLEKKGIEFLRNGHYTSIPLEGNDIFKLGIEFGIYRQAAMIDEALKNQQQPTDDWSALAKVAPPEKWIKMYEHYQEILTKADVAGFYQEQFEIANKERNELKQQPTEVERMKWVKASERLPELKQFVFLKIDGRQNVGHFDKKMPGIMCLAGFGGGHMESEFDKIEWLDESLDSTPNTQADEDVRDYEASDKAVIEPLANNSPKEEDVEKMAEAILMKYWNADDLEDLQMSITLNPQVQFFILAMIEMYNAAKTTK